MSNTLTHIETEKQLVPALRFKEFDGEWSIVTLGDTSEIVGGGTPETVNESYWNGKHQWFTPTELKSKYVSESKRTITDLGLKKSSAKLLPKGTLLFSSRATVGDISIALREVCTNQGFQSFIVNEDNDNEFLYNWIIKHKNLFLKRASGSTFLEISKKEILKLKTLIPSLTEQQKIASFLSAVDEKIQQLTKKKELLEQYKKGVMQQLFSGQLRFKDENGNPYPDWEEKRLGEIGKTFNGLTGKTKEDFGEGKPYIQYMQIFRGSKINPDEFGFVKLNENEKQSRAQFGDAFFTTSSETPKEIGTASVLLDKIEELYLNSFCFGYRPNNIELLVPQFLQFLLRSEIFRRKIIPLAQGSTRYNMSKVELMKLKVDIPQKEEQQKIATYLSSIDTKIEAVNNQITQTQTFKKGLLQQMFVAA
ncbi:restriction endonuclease subunit S [Yeosuana sp. MJ-SS3]|uniref:Restriction endonuclease subunit S n=1 Tax=Gilvirhabdus luticola TaxID=3079858 RepID=A0ABU3U7D2_9FLAO|nr:restriction endonuclease subunit S [Yeosuana sp. MJ-SS3]MDU8886318.1 restriction endonuclease subunit S [Yeosuana sp. MJ-SS3]